MQLRMRLPSVMLIQIIVIVSICGCVGTESDGDFMRRRTAELQREHGPHRAHQIAVRERLARQFEPQMKAAIVELESLGDSIEDLIRSHEISADTRRMASKEVLDKFESTMGWVRYRQLNALREALYAIQEDSLSNQKPSAAQYLLDGRYDTDHPVYIELKDRRDIYFARAQAARWAEEDANQAKLGEIILGYVNMAMQAEQIRNERLKRKGLCLRCEGKGEVPEWDGSVCYGCGGGMTTLIASCPVCHGSRPLFVNTLMRTCGRCGGDGKYR